MIGLSIIGLGAIGERLLPIIQAYKGIEIISVYDIDENRTQEICQKYDVDAVENIELMLEDDSVDAIYLAVPPKYHKDIALDIMKSGKHILCEKPLANDIDEAREMLECAEKLSIVHGMNFPLYHGPACKKIKEMLKQEILGEIKRIELKGIFPNWPRQWQVNAWIDTKEQGGFVREVFTHFIQLTQDLFGQIEIKNTCVTYPDDQGCSETSLLAHGVVGDYQMIFTGMTGVACEEDLKLVFWGTRGVLEFINWRELELINGNHREVIELPTYQATHDLIDAFVKSIEGFDVPLVDFEAGYHAVKVVEDLLKE